MKRQRVISGAVLRSQIRLIKMQGGTVSRDPSDRTITITLRGQDVLKLVRGTRDGHYLVEYPDTDQLIIIKKEPDLMA